jgi:hypothetical protein
MPTKNTPSSNSKKDTKKSDVLKTIQDKKIIVQDAAKEAKVSLSSIRNSERQSAKELKKMEKDADVKLKALQKNVKGFADRTRTNITASFDEVDKIRDETRSSYNRFKRTYDAALNSEKTGIVARRNDIADRHEKIKDSLTSVTDLSKKAQERSVEIKKAHYDSTTSRDKIMAVKNRADEIKTEIERTFHLTSDTTMRGALTERKDEIQKAMVFWRSVLITSAVVLVGAIGYLLLHSPSGGFMDTLANRLVYVTPLFLLIALAYRQYNHERRVLEEYAFKAVMAQTLRNYAVLLSENYPDAEKSQDKILDFLLASMSNIYDRSVLDNNSGFFYQLIVGNKNLGAQATLQEGVSEMTQTVSEKTTKQTKKKADVA